MKNLILSLSIILVPTLSSAAQFTAIAPSIPPSPDNRIYLAIEGEQIVPDSDGMTIPESKVYEWSIDQAPQSPKNEFTSREAQLIATFESERVLAIIPAEYRKREGLVLIREWRVESAMPYAVSFWSPSAASPTGTPPPTLTEIEIKDSPTCQELHSLEVLKGSLRWSCTIIEEDKDGSHPRTIKKTFNTRIGDLRPSARTPKKPVHLPMSETSTLRLRVKNKNHVLPGGFDSLEKVPQKTRSSKSK